MLLRHASVQARFFHSIDDLRWLEIDGEKHLDVRQVCYFSCWPGTRLDLCMFVRLHLGFFACIFLTSIIARQVLESDNNSDARLLVRMRYCSAGSADAETL